jgi:hypothetical protein
MRPLPKMRLCAIAALAVGMIAVSPALLAADPMLVPQQNALVQQYCAVCHTDAHPNGGLSLQQFDAAHPDPGVAAMMLGKLKTGAIGAAGVKLPDDATVQAWIAATAVEAAGAHRWSIHRNQDPATKAAIVSASIVQDVPSAVSADVPDSYRLSVSCRADTQEATMEFAWSPASPKQGQILSAFVDGKPLSTYKVEGTEKMGNGNGGTSGPGSITLYSTRKGSPSAKFAMTLPASTLSVRDALPNETVVFPFGELTPIDRRSLAPCFTGAIASR